VVPVGVPVGPRKDQQPAVTSCSGAAPATRPHPGGVLAPGRLRGERKSGPPPPRGCRASTSAPAHAVDSGGRHGVHRVGRTSGCTTRCTRSPTPRLSGGRADPAFRTKGQSTAPPWSPTPPRAGVAFRAVVADCFYGPSESPGLVADLRAGGVPFVLALKPNQELSRPAEEHAVRTPARCRPRTGVDQPRPARPGGVRVGRTYRDGHTETWSSHRLPGRPRSASTGRCGWSWPPPTRRPCPRPAPTYLATNLARPDLPTAPASPFPPATYSEIIRLYGQRAAGSNRTTNRSNTNSAGQHFQVRSDRAFTAATRPW
jgi:hypothetical protein